MGIQRARQQNALAGPVLCVFEGTLCKGAFQPGAWAQVVYVSLAGGSEFHTPAFSAAGHEWRLWYTRKTKNSQLGLYMDGSLGTFFQSRPSIKFLMHVVNQVDASKTITKGRLQPRWLLGLLLLPVLHAQVQSSCATLQLCTQAKSNQTEAQCGFVKTL